jgi:hypothetical protein
MSNDRHGKLQHGCWRLAGGDDSHIGYRSVRDVSAGGHLQPIDTDNCARIQQRCTTTQSWDDHWIGV